MTGTTDRRWRGKHGLAGYLVLAMLAAGCPPPPPPVSPSPALQRVAIEDFSDVVRESDLATNDFAGPMGIINPPGRALGTRVLRNSQSGSSALDLSWQFDGDRAAFTGLYLSLVPARGEHAAGILAPSRGFDLDRIDGDLEEPGGPRKFQSIEMSLTYKGPQPLTVRAEVEDVTGGRRFTRFRLSPSDAKQHVSWAFRDKALYDVVDGRDLDPRKAVTVSLVVEHRHAGDGVKNPAAGSMLVHGLWFVLDRPDVAPTSDDAVLDLISRRACGYFVDRTSRDPRSAGFPQDRSDTPDLLTTGGIGFSLGALVTCAERGWITRQIALTSATSVLRSLADRRSFGPEPRGRLGHKGWMSHFLGSDGRRSGESEVSTIDTGLALLGVLTTQSYFTGDLPAEAEVRRLAQAVFDQVDFPAMVEPSTRQFYLGWAPGRPGPSAGFEIPDGQGGFFSGSPGAPQTIDHYTDEGLLLTLLAAGSTTHPVAADVWCAWSRSRDERGLVRSWPGALFTYTLARAFIDTAALDLPACPGQERIDWYENSRLAVRSVILYATANPAQLPTYGPDAWGISAAANAGHGYEAYGAPVVALDRKPPQDGTVSYSAMMSAVTLGDDLRNAAVQAARKAWERGHWDPRFGLPDAWNDDIRKVASMSPSPTDQVLRQSGPWVQRALFAIDQGAMLLQIENARSGLIWKLMAANRNLITARDRLRTEVGSTIAPAPGPSGTSPSGVSPSVPPARPPSSTTSVTSATRQLAPPSISPAEPAPATAIPPASAPITTPLPLARCDAGSFVRPSAGAVVPQTVDVSARLTAGGAPGQCASAGVSASVVVVDRFGNAFPWDLYCTFESCTRNALIVGNSETDAGQSFSLELAVGGRTVDSISIARAG